MLNAIGVCIDLEFVFFSLNKAPSDDSDDVIVVVVVVVDQLATVLGSIHRTFIRTHSFNVDTLMCIFYTGAHCAV